MRRGGEGGEGREKLRGGANRFATWIKGQGFPDYISAHKEDGPIIKKIANTGRWKTLVRSLPPGVKRKICQYSQI